MKAVPEGPRWTPMREADEPMAHTLKAKDGLTTVEWAKRWLETRFLFRYNTPFLYVWLLWAGTGQLGAARHAWVGEQFDDKGKIKMGKMWSELKVEKIKIVPVWTKLKHNDWLLISIKFREDVVHWHYRQTTVAPIIYHRGSSSRSAFRRNTEKTSSISLEKNTAQIKEKSQWSFFSQWEKVPTISLTNANLTLNYSIRNVKTSEKRKTKCLKLI